MVKIDITQHILVPKHTIVSDKEKKEILEKHKVTLEELPKILKTDAAIKDLKPKNGDVVKVIRKSPTAGEALFYRVVVSD